MKILLLCLMLIQAIIFMATKDKYEKMMALQLIILMMVSMK